MVEAIASQEKGFQAGEDGEVFWELLDIIMGEIDEVKIVGRQMEQLVGEVTESVASES